MTEQQLLMLLNEWKHKHNISTEALKDFEAILDKLKGEDNEHYNYRQVKQSS